MGVQFYCLNLEVCSIEHSSIKMKSALILLFVGIVSCGQFYSPGQEYVYQYYGRILTGLPQINNTFAGLALKGQVILQATSQNNYKLQLKNVNFGTFNEKLSDLSQRTGEMSRLRPILLLLLNTDKFWSLQLSSRSNREKSLPSRSQPRNLNGLLT